MSCVLSNASGVDIDILIRPETPADVAGIRGVTQRAFAGRPYSAGNEQDIVDALRARNALAISLVAEQAGRILGHVAFSPASSEDGSPGWYTLGPVSVCLGSPVPNCVVNFHAVFHQ